MLWYLITSAITLPFILWGAFQTKQTLSICIGFLFIVVQVYILFQMILLYQKKKGKYLLHLALYCRIAGIILLILAVLAAILAVLSGYVNRVSNRNEHIEWWVLSGIATLFVVLAAEMMFIRRALLQANNLLTGKMIEKDAFLPAAIASFVIIALVLITNILNKSNQAPWLQWLLALNGVVHHAVLGLLFWRGSKEYRSKFM